MGNIHLFVKILCERLLSTFEKDCVLLCEIILRDSLRNAASYFVKYCLMTFYLYELCVVFIVFALINEFHIYTVI